MELEFWAVLTWVMNYNDGMPRYVHCAVDETVLDHRYASCTLNL